MQTAMGSTKTLMKFNPQKENEYEKGCTCNNCVCVLMTVPMVAQAETRDDCVASFGINVGEVKRWQELETAIGFLDSIRRECETRETPAEEIPTTELADKECTEMYLWDNGWEFVWIRSGTDPANADERIGELYVGDSICATGEVVEWVGKDTGDWQQVIYEGEIAYVFNQWLRNSPQVIQQPTPVPAPVQEETASVVEVPVSKVEDKSYEIHVAKNRAHDSKMQIRQRIANGGWDGRDGKNPLCGTYLQAMHELHKLCHINGQVAACNEYERNANLNSKSCKA